MTVESIKYTVHEMKQAFFCVIPICTMWRRSGFYSAFQSVVQWKLLRRLKWNQCLDSAEEPVARLRQKGQEVMEEYGHKKCQRKCQAAGLCGCLSGAVRSCTDGFFRARLPCASEQPVWHPAADDPQGRFGYRRGVHLWGWTTLARKSCLLQYGIYLSIVTAPKRAALNPLGVVSNFHCTVALFCTSLIPERKSGSLVCCLLLSRRWLCCFS